MNMENTVTHEDTPLLRAIAELPCDISPERDLWPGIRDRIDPVRTPRALRLQRWMPLATAAGLVLAVSGPLAGVWVGYSLGTTKAAARAQVAAVTKLERIETSFAAARASQLRSLLLAGTHIDAGTRDSLRVIDTAVGQLHAVMATDPGNPFYLNALLMTRQREIELLSDIATPVETHL